MKHVLFSVLIASLLTKVNLFCGAAAWQAFVTCQDAGVVLPIGVPSGIPGDPSSVIPSSQLSYLALTPDGTRAIVADAFGSIVLLDTTTTPISVLDRLTGLSDPFIPAITPDGKNALVASYGGSVVYLVQINDTSISLVKTLSDPNFTAPNGIAITPDGLKAVVSNGGGEMNIIDLTTSPISITTPLKNLGYLTLIAITPNGSKALIGEDSSGSILVVDLTTMMVQERVEIDPPQEIAITPDGTRAVAVGAGGIVTLLDLTTTPITVPSTVSGVGDQWGVAITPDGNYAVLSDYSNSFACLCALTPTSITLLEKIPTPSNLLGVSITPDQAPTAAFTYNKCGARATFNASSSFSPVGEIASYEWNFGDGTTLTTSNPGATHTYDAFEGTFSVTLTVTNTAGTSTAQSTSFTGRTMSKHGGPSAQTTQLVQIITPKPPATFHGKIRTRRGKSVLKTWWNKSSSKRIRKYEIFKWNKKVVTSLASHKRRRNFYPLSHIYSHKLSKNTIALLHAKYKIRAVDKQGNAGRFTHLRVRRAESVQD